MLHNGISSVLLCCLTLTSMASCASFVYGVVIGCLVLDLVMAENVGGEQDDSGNNPASPDPSAPHSTTMPTVDWLEMEVLGFRLWMIIGFVLVGLLIIIIVLCCVFDCRVPRTKQEIDADYEKKQAKRAAKKNKKQQKQSSIHQPHRVNNGDRASIQSRSLQSLVIPNPPPMPPPMPPSHPPSRASLTSAQLRGSPAPGHTNGEFQLYEKPYGRRMLYNPAGGLSIDSTGSTGSRKFRGDPEGTAHVLASLPRQANSRV